MKREFLSLLLALLGGGLLVSVLLQFSADPDLRRLNQNGRSATAEIIDSGVRGFGRSKVPFIRYRYRVDESKTAISESVVLNSDHYEAGQMIDVIYDPSVPEDAELSQLVHELGNESLFWRYLLLGLGVISLAFSGYFARTGGGIPD